jgi:hypothetical protein
MNFAEDETPPVKRRDLCIHLDLPKDAPAGHPHMIDIEMLSKMFPLKGACAVDTIATVLYKWDPQALSNLLDLSKRRFHWCHSNEWDYECYVIREDRQVRVSTVEQR